MRDPGLWLSPSSPIFPKTSNSLKHAFAGMLFDLNHMEILYQDLDLLAINKPSGLSTLPEGWNPSLPHIRSLLEDQFGPLWIVHRLDKETSGVLLLARNARSHKILNDQFANRQTKKIYSCIVFGYLEENTQCAQPLRINGDRKHRTVIDLERGKPATTRFEVIESLSGSCTLLRALPESGYTHQIRAHCLTIGFPILGDPLYFTPESSSFSRGKMIPRTLLHASQITFTHPGTMEEMKIIAPLQDDFADTILRLKNQGASD